MHRHGTMKGRWKALAFGGIWVLLGWLIARPGWTTVFAEAVPRPPGGLELLSIFGGGLLILIGLVLGLTPHIIWALRSFYKEDFAPETRCPVMLVCPRCREYNNRARFHCTHCATSLQGARSAGGQHDDEPPPGPAAGGGPQKV